ncbi:MAG: hypothetical protein ABR985_08610 [Methanotrichaceae archaeon]
MSANEVYPYPGVTNESTRIRRKDEKPLYKWIGDERFTEDGCYLSKDLSEKEKADHPGAKFRAQTICEERPEWSAYDKTEEKVLSLYQKHCAECKLEPMKRKNCWKDGKDAEAHTPAPVPPKVVPGAEPEGGKKKEIIEIKPVVKAKEPEPEKKAEIEDEKLLEASRYIRDEIKSGHNKAQRQTKVVAEKVKEDQRILTKALKKLFGRAPSSSSGKESYKYWSKAVLPKVEAAIKTLEAKIASPASGDLTAPTGTAPREWK